MGLWIFLSLAVVCSSLLKGYRVYAESKSRVSKADLERLEARLACVERSGDLEERVRTLEAIVTDPEFQLDREISKLDKPSDASASERSNQ